jgi:hypothetical protein
LDARDNHAGQKANSRKKIAPDSQTPPNSDSGELGARIYGGSLWQRLRHRLPLRHFFAIKLKQRPRK